MKTVSEQLKELGLSHGDLCEIEGVEGRAMVLTQVFAIAGSSEGPQTQLYARAPSELVKEYYHNKVTCGWKACNTTFMGDLVIRYEKVLPKPESAPLPEAVEAIIEKFNNGSENIHYFEFADWSRDFARAIIGACKKV